MTVTRRHHPLQGQLLDVVSRGRTQIVLRLRDGTSMWLPRAWTDVDGGPAQHLTSLTWILLQAVRTLVPEKGTSYFLRNVSSASGEERGARASVRPSSLAVVGLDALLKNKRAVGRAQDLADMNRSRLPGEGADSRLGMDTGSG